LWFFRRNEQIIGSKSIVVKQPGALTVAGDDPKKFAAAMVEYSKEKVNISLIKNTILINTLHVHVYNFQFLPCP
jgi:hypothetical protein